MLRFLIILWFFWLKKMFYQKLYQSFDKFIKTLINKKLNITTFFQFCKWKYIARVQNPGRRRLLCRLEASGGDCAFCNSTSSQPSAVGLYSRTSPRVAGPSGSTWWRRGGKQVSFPLRPAQSPTTHSLAVVFRSVFIIQRWLSLLSVGLWNIYIYIYIYIYICQYVNSDYQMQFSQAWAWEM